MFEKWFVLTIFFTILGMIPAQDLAALIPPRPSTPQNVTKCFTCDTPSSCRKPKAVICEQNAANSTRLILSQHFSNVSNITNSQYECLKIRYTLKKSVQIAVSGCINLGLNPCNLKAKNATLASASNSCHYCSKSLCNPAGTFSSSLTIILSVMFGLLLWSKCQNA